MELKNLLFRVEEIESQQRKIAGKYEYGAVWSDEDMREYGVLNRELEELTGVANHDVLTVTSLIRMIIKVREWELR